MGEEANSSLLQYLFKSFFLFLTTFTNYYMSLCMGLLSGQVDSCDSYTYVIVFVFTCHRLRIKELTCPSLPDICPYRAISSYLLP